MADINNQDMNVILPVYYGVEFLEQSLPPLIATLDKKELQELIVIDDISLYESVKIAKAFGATITFPGGRNFVVWILSALWKPNQL